MPLHYLRMALRLLVADRWFSLVNLGGLALGLASAILIGLYVLHETSYDRFLPDSETLFRVDTVETAPGQQSIEIALAPGPLAAAMRAQFPQISQVTRAYRFEANAIRDNQPFAEHILAADPDFFSVLGLPFASGSPERALAGTNSVVLSERAAEKYFGTTRAIGRRLTLRLPQLRDFTVSAVFRTIPDSSHLDFDIAIPHAAYFVSRSDGDRPIPERWSGSYFHTYVRLRSAAGESEIESGLPALTDRNIPASLREALGVPPHEVFRYRLVAARDLHFDGAAIEAMRPPSSRTTVAALSAAAGLILLIAGINFANLLAARSSLRAREVALRKVVGATRGDIIVQFLLEALLVAAIAGLVSVALAELALPWLESSFGLPPDYLSPNILSVWLGIAVLIFATAAAGGIYPSLLIARIAPATVFNGEGARISGGRLRGALLVLQFAISIGLVAVTIIMLMQWRLTQQLDLGFDRRGLMVIRAPDGASAEQARAFADALARNPEMVGTTLSSAVPSDISEDNLTVLVAGQSRPITIGYHVVDNAFFRTYSVTPLAGRTSAARAAQPSASGSPPSVASVVLNRSSLDRLGFADPQAAIGQVLGGGGTALEVVGVVPDLHFRSLHASVRDELYILSATPGTNVTVRVAPGAETRAADLAERLWRQRFPGELIDRAWLADLIGDLYAKEARQLVLLTIFSTLAIMLSCLGLLAMAAFALQRRTREIAVRKVLGASANDILRLLVWDFLKPVLIGSMIAWPVAWYVTRDWLDTFSYRIDMPPLAFLSATLAVVLLAGGAVAVHSLRTSRLHPAIALRRE